MPAKTLCGFIAYTAARKRRILMWLAAAYLGQAIGGAVVGITAAFFVTGVLQ